ncbi:MAG: PRC-barrel domain-containing protein [Bacillota bacterium]
MRARQLKGFPVIDLNNGVMIGRVQDLAVDPAQKRVAALVVGEKGLLKGKGRIIPFAQVHSIGRDAVTIGGEAERYGEEAAAERLQPYSFLGNSVISSRGDYIARVHDYTFSTANGDLESLLLHDFKERDKKNREISLLVEGVHSLGQDYIIAAAGYTAYLRELSAEEQAAPAEGEEAPYTNMGPEETEDMGKDTFNMRGRIGELWDRVEREISREGKELAFETREQVKTYIRGKKAGYTVKNNRGNFLVRSGEVITGEIISEAEAQERLAPLFFSVFSGEVEDSLKIISDRISRIFKG